MRRTLVVLSRLDTLHRVVCALIAAAISGVSMHAHPLWTASLATYDTFAFVSVALLLITIALPSRDQIRLVAQKQNVGRTIVSVAVIGAACAALFAVAFLIRGVRSDAHYHFTLHLLLALATVVLSWLSSGNRRPPAWVLPGAFSST